MYTESKISSEYDNNTKSYNDEESPSESNDYDQEESKTNENKEEKSIKKVKSEVKYYNRKNFLLKAI